MTHGCKDCKYCRCYLGDYWTPDEYECVGYEREVNIDLTDDQIDEIFTRVWENGEVWSLGAEPICPAWEEAPTPEDDYWERYGHEENRMDKDA